MDNASLAQTLNGIDAFTPADDGRSLSQRRADGLVALSNTRLAGTCDGHDELGTQAGDLDAVHDAAGQVDGAGPARRPVCDGRTAAH